MNSLRASRSPDEGETKDWPSEPPVIVVRGVPEEMPLLGRDKMPLFARIWRAGSDAPATVLVVHGFGEHSWKYDHVAGWICDAGMNAITYDLRGHGRSGGKRGHYAHYSEMMDDLEVMIEHAPKPLFLYAHSFGAQVAILTGIQRGLPILGAFLSAPWIRLAFEPPVWRVALAGVMSVIRPSFTQGTRLGPDRLTRDIDFLNSMPHQEFLHKSISARAYFESVKAGEEIERRMEEWSYPFCLAQGDDDPVTSLAKNREFFERCSSTDKTLNIYHGYRHEIHNDLGRENVHRDAMAWFAKRLSSA